jgi:hypothetical protein
MTKLTLATQLRFHFARQGFPTGEIARNSDDAMIAMIAAAADGVVREDTSLASSWIKSSR